MTSLRTTEEDLPRETTEEKLRMCEDKFHLITENMTDVIWQTTPELVITYVTSSVKKLLGYEPEEFVGGHLCNFLTPAAQELVRSRYSDIMTQLAEHKEFESEVYVAEQIRKDGTTVWTEVVSNPTFNNAGQFTGFQGVTRDVSRRKEDEDALRASEEKYRNLVENICDVVFEIDARGEVTYISPVVRNVVGYEAEDLIGKPFLGFVHPEDSNLLMKRFSELAKGVEYPLEYRIVGKSGEVRYVRTFTKPIIKNNIFVGARGTLIEITERKRLEAERSEMERTLLHAQKLESLSVMAGRISHDFNNQLAVVLGNLELALTDLSPDSVAKESIMNAIEAADRSVGLSLQMLIYSGSAFYLPQDIHVNELLNRTSDLLKSSVPKHVDLKLEIGDALPPIKGDADQIQRLVTNILDNALEAIGNKEGAVRLSTGVMDCDEAYLRHNRLEMRPEPGRFVFLEITDTGCGMDAETLFKLFDPFFTTKSNNRGLGMSEVMGIAKAHRGALFVVSQLGKGTTIQVLFPVSKESQASSLTDRESVETKSSALGGVPNRRKTILLVDDEEGVRDLTVQRLNVLGYDTITAADGTQGVRIFRERLNEIDLVILDFAMPRMDGLEAFEELIRIKPDVKVILCSGYTEDTVLRSFTGQHAAAVLYKPYKIEDLKGKLDRLLGTTG